MNLIRWKRPTSDIISNSSGDIFSLLQKDINDIFHNFGLDTVRERNLSKGYWNPIVEFKETPSDYVLHAELPGFKKEDVHVTYEDDVLTLKGEKKAEENKK